MDRKLIITDEQELFQIIYKAVDAALDARKIGTYPDNVPDEAGPAYVSKQAAAKLIGCSVATVDNFRRAGKIEARRLGNKAVRFDRAEILALLESKPRRR